MKVCSIMAAAGLVLVLAASGHAQAPGGPREVGGFVLGDDISAYREKVDLESALPLRYAGYLRQVVIREIPGFKTGQVYYGMCAHPGRILRIRLKYADSSKAFFDALLGRIRERYGKPGEWRGDPFGVVVAWKWSLTTADGERVSMILQHNALDEEESKGNTIKLALTGMLDAERACYLKGHPEEAEEEDGGGKGARPGPADWGPLVPR